MWKYDELTKALLEADRRANVAEAELAIMESPVPKMIDQWFVRSFAAWIAHERKRQADLERVRAVAEELRREAAHDLRRAA